MNYKEQAVEALSHLSTDEISEVMSEFKNLNDDKVRVVNKKFTAHLKYLQKISGFYDTEYNKFLDLRQDVQNNQTIETVGALQKHIDGFEDRESHFTHNTYSELEEEMENIDDH